MRRHVWWFHRSDGRAVTAATLILLSLVMAGCALPGAGNRPTHTVRTSQGATPTATVASWMGTPRAAPAGWQTYHAPHFALALPADWRVQVDVEQLVAPAEPLVAEPRIGYALFSPPQNPRAIILEWDQLAPDEVRDRFCTRLADQPAVNFAGIPMRYTTGDGSSAAFERVWTFVSDHGTVYQLWTEDGPVGAPEIAVENRAVLETFTPQYTAWGCI